MTQISNEYDTESKVQIRYNPIKGKKLSRYLLFIFLVAFGGFITLFIHLNIFAKVPSLHHMNAHSFLLSCEECQGKPIYTDDMLHTSWSNPVSLKDAKHLVTLQNTCTINKDDIIVSQSHQLNTEDNVLEEKMTFSIKDPDLFHQLSICPDVDLYVPLGLRNHGYCEDASAYTMYLESRMLPRWVFTTKFIDPHTNLEMTYHEICPFTPVIFFNHYWDGLLEETDWPESKQVYLMPNIEMNELTPEHYWRADLVLCKTVECTKRAKRWYSQHGKRDRDHGKARVLYTRHTTTDIARVMLAKEYESHNDVNKLIKRHEKNFRDVEFYHIVGSSWQKGTRKIIECWVSDQNAQLPPLNLFIKKSTYNELIPAPLRYTLEKMNNTNINVDHIPARELGLMLAEKAAFFLCPSRMEGYGHYINQVRAALGLIISTDAPPMNELITHTSGVLVKAKRHIITEQLFGGHYDGSFGLNMTEDVKVGEDGEQTVGLAADVHQLGVCEAVKTVLAMSVEERQRRALLAQKYYNIDLHYFAKKMTELRAYSRKHGSIRRKAMSKCH